jgi:hypothetical protein
LGLDKSHLPLSKENREIRQYLLLERLYIKAVFAWTKGDVSPSFSEDGYHSNYMYSGRLRFQYNF